jgi:hypothetical protein
MGFDDEGDHLFDRTIPLMSLWLSIELITDALDELDTVLGSPVYTVMLSDGSGWAETEMGECLFEFDTLDQAYYKAHNLKARLVDERQP